MSNVLEEGEEGGEEEEGAAQEVGGVPQKSQEVQATAEVLVVYLTYSKRVHPVVFRLQGASWGYRVMPRAVARLAIVIVLTRWVETSYT